MTDCTYCGCEIEAHDPVFVFESSDEDGGKSDEGSDGVGDGGESDERVPAGRFCNYACLSAHVEEAGLADGATCRLDV